MIMRYFLELSYNGAPFHGWQSQPNAISVQEKLETALSTLLRKQTAVTGAGRTDTGVHARQMYAHFDFDYPFSDEKRIILSLNSMLGPDIAIYRLIPVQENMHARFDATERTYKYLVNFTKNPFINKFSWYSSSKLDIELMNEAARYLLKTNDFTSFAKLHSDSKTNICDVREAVWNPAVEDNEAFNFLGDLDGGFVFTIRADRFLRNMVRAIVGTLVEVGRKKIRVEDFIDIINSQNRCNAGTSMPAHALFLWKVEYPFIS